MYKLVATDLDGTALNDAHKLSEANYRTIKELEKLGIIVVLASGRMYKSMLPYVKELNLGTKTIAYNGAMIVDENDEIVYEDTLPQGFPNELIEYCDKNKLHLNYYFDDNLYSKSDDKWLKLYGDRTGMYANIVKEFPSHKLPTKMLIIDEPEKIKELYKELSALYGERVYVTISNVEYLEFMPKNADKGSALKRVADMYNVKQEEVIFLGDASNDLPAIQWAGTSVAMETAPDSVKNSATFITSGTEEDGFSVILREIFGIK